MPTMRYLLAFYSETTSEWRCLDTDVLPGPVRRPEDIPTALKGSPAITLCWMLERRELRQYEATSAGDTLGPVFIYELDPTGSSFGTGNDYLGAWIEMFMQTHEPIGSIAIEGDKTAVRPEGFNALRELATEPLRAKDEACQQTMDRMRGHRPSVADQSEAKREAEPQEPS